VRKRWGKDKGVAESGDRENGIVAELGAWKASSNFVYYSGDNIIQNINM
jgi:hypothetical protein